MTRELPQIELSIVATMFKSERFIPEFRQRVVDAAEKITSDFEVVLVNDGSPDESAAIVKAICAADPRFVLVDLSRNFGHHAAIMAGLEAARGEWVYLTDSDLEEQPEWLPEFWSAATKGNHDVVYGVQERRTGRRFDNLLGRIFWSLLNAGAGINIPENQMTCRLMSRAYLDSLLSVRDRVLYLGGLFPWVGYRQHPLQLVKTPRTVDTKSTYGLTRKLRQAVDSMTSFTAAPLTLFFAAGALIWVGSLVYGLTLVAQRAFFPDTILSGFTSIMFSIWFLGGSIMLGIGVVGQYIAKVFQEVKDRPQYVVRSITRSRQ
ncbi:MAG: glycosyltransferase family 2 protein [Rhodothermales bacterium]